MELRIATADDVAWINERYASVGFMPSDPAKHRMIVAEVDGVAAGIGRISTGRDEACELGGMLVFDEFRGRGVARAIIEALLQHAGDRTVYCIPFAELEPIYAGSGFVRCDANASLPDEIREKLDWCAKHLPDRDVIAMVR